MRAWRHAAAGFTLLELMIVVMLVALGAGLMAVALRDASDSKLEEEGARLSALLESARSQSRIAGTDVRWEPVTTPEGGFRFVGLPAGATTALPHQWLDAATQANVVGAAALQLGPEPLIGAQRVVLHLNQRELAIATDGLAPFGIVKPGADVAAAR